MVEIADESGTEWFAEITEFWQYQAIVDWAGRSRQAGHLLLLPEEFCRHRLRPFSLGTCLADFTGLKGSDPRIQDSVVYKELYLSSFPETMWIQIRKAHKRFPVR